MRTNSFLASHGSLLDEPGRSRVARQLHAILEDWYGKKKLKQLRVLDYGCSTGIITNFIAGSSKEVMGIDVDEVAIRKAKQKYKRHNVSFLLTNGIRIPFKNNPFDLVICNQVYSYLDNPPLMVSEIYRVLKKEGVCLFTGDNSLRPIEPLYNLPFIRLLPRQITILLLKAMGYKNIYIGSYKTFWGLKELCSQFTIHDYTIKVLKNPKRFKYRNLEKCSALLAVTPDFILKTLEPFFPSFIFILEKKG